MKRFETSLYLLLFFLFLSLPNTLFSQLTWQQTSYVDSFPAYKFISKQNTLFAAFYGSGVYKTTNQGDNWIACHGSDSTNLLARDIVLNGNNLFVGTNGNGVLKSTNSGDTWQTANDTIIPQNIWSLLVIPNGSTNRLFAGTSKGLFYTDNEGVDWLQDTLPRPKAHHQIIFSLGVKENKILAGSSGYVYLSEDLGVTWQQIKVPTKLDIMSIKVQNDLWLLGTSGSGIISSTDGLNWSVTYGDGGNVRSMVVNNNNSLIISFPKEGVRDLGNAQNFTNINNGFSGKETIRSLAYHNTKLYAGTYHHGIWRYDVPPIGLIHPTSSRVANSQVNLFPNPTSAGQITLSYTLEAATQTRIDLLDAYGKHITKITPPAENYKGFHSINYDVSSLGGGIYYLHLQLGDQAITKQLILIK